MISIRPGPPPTRRGVAACVDRVARERRYLAIVEGFAIDETARFIARLLAAGGVHRWPKPTTARSSAPATSCPSPPRGMRHVGRLGIAVLPGFRRRGLGRRLLCEAVDGAFAAGLGRVELEVFASNREAIRLYESAGFRREGCRRAARRLDGREDDLLLYGVLAGEWAGGAT
ncbi:MAG: GNAT family N-acetyltransferase [Gammaproteobacteria bacterium]|nr:GNAT family N-acetyltransferase [Gammaproteobacteria bacterium]